MRMKKSAGAFLCCLAACLLGTSGCSSASRPAENASVVVAVAADLQFAFEEILLDLHRVHPEIEIRPTFGSSASLFAQISNRAPFDMFLAADVDFLHRLAQDGLVDKPSIFVYGQSRLAVWVKRDSELPIGTEGMKVLLLPQVNKIAIANPVHSPYGRAARELLERLSMWPEVESKIVLAENVVQTTQLVENGSADVGIIAMTLALAPPFRATGQFARIPDDVAPVLMQGGGIMTRAKDKVACQKLKEYLLSPRGREILSEYGLLPPREN
jgi:molybdate transport system substrate-binding protein